MSMLRLLLPLATAFLLAETAFSQVPANDNFANRTDLGSVLPIEVSGNTTGATAEEGEPLLGDGVGSIWWKWQAPASGLYQIDSLDTPQYTHFGVYIGGSLGSLAKISDTYYEPFAPLLPRNTVVFWAEENQLLTIQVVGSDDFRNLVALRIQASDLPTITNIEIDPPLLVATGKDELEATITLDIAHPVGVETIIVSVLHPDRVASNSVAYYHTFSNSRLLKISGDDTVGTYQGRLEFNPYLPSGEWQISVRFLKVGEPELKYPDDLNFPHQIAGTVQVNNEGVADRELPQISKMTFSPSVVDVGNGAQDVTVLIEASDDTGIEDFSIRFTEPGGGSAVAFLNSFTGLVQGDTRNGLFEGVVTIPGDAQEGTLVPSLTVWDRGERRHIYGSSRNYTPFPSGSDTVLEVNRSIELDLEGPRLTGFFADPSSIDVGASSQTVRFSIGIDDVSGVSSAKLSLYDANSLDLVREIDLISERVSGDSFSGSYEVDLVFPGGSATQVLIPSLILTDEEGNVSYYDALGAGLPEGSTQRIVVTGQPDIGESSHLTGFSISPENIDITGDGAEITVVVEVYDSLSSFESLDLELLLGTYKMSHHFERPGNPGRTIRFEHTFEVPRYLTSGLYQASVTVNDSLAGTLSYGNGSPFTYPENSQPSLRIFNAGVSDFRRPELHSISFSPNPVARDRMPATIIVSADLFDEISGVAAAHVSFDGIFGEEDALAQWVFDPVSSAFPESFRAHVDLQGLPLVDHLATTVVIIDAVGRRATHGDSTANGSEYPEDTEPLMIVR